MVDKKKEEGITSSELEYILDVNKKAVEIQVEVGKQNEQVITSLDDLNDKVDIIIKTQEDQVKLFKEIDERLRDKIEKKIEEIEKNLFRLVIILGGAGIGTILTIIQTFLHK